jgi:hypothetical protein
MMASLDFAFDVGLDEPTLERRQRLTWIKDLLREPPRWPLGPTSSPEVLQEPNYWQGIVAAAILWTCSSIVGRPW